MLDFSFGELLLLAVIALVVLGPEKLPHAARMAGAWVGRIRRSMISIQAEIEREVAAQEMQQRIEKEMQRVKDSDVSRQLREDVASLTDQVAQATGHAQQAGEQIQQAGEQVQQATRAAMSEPAPAVSAANIMTPLPKVTTEPGAEAEKQLEHSGQQSPVQKNADHPATDPAVEKAAAAGADHAADKGSDKPGEAAFKAYVQAGHQPLDKTP